MIRIIGIILFLLLVFVGMQFAVQNMEEVSVNYFLGESSLPLSVLMLGAFALGAILAAIVGSFVNTRLRLRNALLNSKLKSLDKKLGHAQAQNRIEQDAQRV